MVDEFQSFAYEKATGGGYETLPTTQIATLQALALVADQAVTLRLDGQSDAGIVLSAGGLLLVLDATIDASATTNVTLDNSSGSTAVCTAQLTATLGTSSVHLTLTVLPTTSFSAATLLVS